MELLENIYRQIILNESVTDDEINDALDNHKRIIINYHSKGEDENTGARVIEVYAWGQTTAGNDVIRAFQPYGDTTSRVPSWKYFRVDRISAWQPTEQIFTRPANEVYKGLGDFNKFDDKTMAIVYKIATFDNDITKAGDMNIPGPKTKEDVYKTDSEIRMERLKQQTDNQISINDIKVGDAFKQLDKKPQQTSPGPKTKEDVYKTDSEIKMERLKQQIQNPQKIDLTQFDRKPKQKSEEEQKKQLDKLRQTLSDKPITLGDLNKKMKEKPDLFKTDSEKNMERLKQQLDNPQKIDLTKIPKR